MLSNPPYGKSWKTDQDRMGGRNGITDPRFVIQHAGDPEYSLVTRSSDGQLMFLANMLSKMKEDTQLGSRIAEVHNGSSLFTGDAGQGESNIRRWIIENDWLEAIVGLPLNMFYNTGIATYVWVLTNRKPEHRKGTSPAHRRDKVVHTPSSGTWVRKNCELSPDEDIQAESATTFLNFEESEQSKIFPERGIRVLEGDSGAPAPRRGHRPRKSPQCQGNQGELKDQRPTLRVGAGRSSRRSPDEMPWPTH